MEVYCIETGNFMCDGGAMFGVVPKSMWNRKYPCDENNYCNCAIRSMLVVSADRRILIDCGMGDKQSKDFFKHQYLNGEERLLSSLNKKGFYADDITDVVFTHLHFDHCGGAVKWDAQKNDYELVFKNAQHWVSKEHWEQYLHPNVREKDAFLDENIMPIKDAGKLNFVENEGELFPNFKLKLFHGHTKGLMIPFLNFNGQELVFVGDFIPTVANVSLKWVSAYDLHPVSALSEKAAFLKEAVKNNTILFFQHDITTECCSLKNTEKGVKVDRCFSFSELLVS